MRTAHTPPRPRLAFRVGITGHRLVRLEQGDIDRAAVGARLRSALVDVQRSALACRHDFGEVYSGEPLLRIVSPLAEGADQMAAEAALELGYQLHVPLPCLPAIYVRGFQRGAARGAEDPCVAFERLLGRAESVQVLDGRPTAALDGAAYAAVGRAVLRHSDLLIAIWDQAPADGAGGTAAVVAQARAWQIPVVMIDPRDPERWSVDGDDGTRARGDLALVVQRILAPPGSDPEDGAERHGRHHQQPSRVAPALAEYLHTRPTGLYGGMFSALVALCALESPFRVAPTRLGKQCIARARRTWDAIWSDPAPLDSAVTQPISRLLREYFAWADGLADRFGVAHRDASVAPYVLAPLTVIAAVVLQIVMARAFVSQAVQAIVEFLILGLNLLFYETAVRGGYHERWIDYRSLAEELRHLAYLWPLGRPLRSVSLVGEAATEASHFEWVGWYGRAVSREGGLYPCVFTPDRLAECRTMLVEHFLRPQCHYHGRTEVRFRRVTDRVHSTTLWLFRLAFLLAILDVGAALVFHHLPPSQTPLSDPLGWGVIAAALAVIMPYIATGAHGFVSQGDFWNLSRRSQRMCRQLEPLMASISLAPPTLETLGTFAEDAADIMRDEVLNWRVFVRLKPPALG